MKQTQIKHTSRKRTQYVEYWLAGQPIGFVSQLDHATGAWRLYAVERKGGGASRFLADFPDRATGARAACLAARMYRDGRTLAGMRKGYSVEFTVGLRAPHWQVCQVFNDFAETVVETFDARQVADKAAQVAAQALAIGLARSIA